MAKQNVKNNVATIDTPYAQEQYAAFQKQYKQLIFKRRRLAVIFMVALLLFGLAGFHLFNDRQSLKKLETIKVKTEASAAAADAKVATLKQDVSLLQDESYVAKLARSRLYYSKDGELVFVLPEQDSSKESSSEDALKTIVDSEAAEK